MITPNPITGPVPPWVRPRPARKALLAGGRDQSVQGGTEGAGALAGRRQLDESPASDAGRAAPFDVKVDDSTWLPTMSRPTPTRCASKRSTIDRQVRQRPGGARR